MRFTPAWGCLHRWNDAKEGGKRAVSTVFPNAFLVKFLYRMWINLIEFGRKEKQFGRQLHKVYEAIRKEMTEVWPPFTVESKRNSYFCSGLSTRCRMKAVKPKKHLGQHFLTDLDIARRIADTVDACPDIPVLEIGPGMGVLTQYLVTKGRPVKAVEIDAESVAYLHEAFPKLRENIIGEDFLRMDLNRIFDGQPFVLTGNYPYDISSQIFFKMLDYKDLIPCCTGMIQREVAQRIAGVPGNKAYGILSVLIQAWYDVEYLFTVDENVFNPPPKVKSAVIRMTRNGVTDLGCNERLFKRLVKTVFNQRRKMLRVSVKQMFAADKPGADFFALEVMTKRPEQLTVAQFVELTNIVEEALDRLNK